MFYFRLYSSYFFLFFIFISFLLGKSLSLFRFFFFSSIFFYIFPSFFYLFFLFISYCHLTLEIQKNLDHSNDFFFYGPCSFRTWTNMSFHNFLFFVGLSNVFITIILHSNIYLVKVWQMTLCISFSRLVYVKSSKPSFLITSSVNFSCRILIFTMNDLFTESSPLITIENY